MPELSEIQTVHHPKYGTYQRRRPVCFRYSNQWPHALEQKLVELHGQGLTFSKIAQLVGKSRSAVSGKIGRMRARGRL